MGNGIKVTVWDEHRHWHTDSEVKAAYPNGLHMAIKESLEANGFEGVRTATLDEPEHGLAAETLSGTDVLFWWGHMAHSEVDDAVVQRVYDRVLDGMGLVVLHSGHASKIFAKLMGTRTDQLRWREAGEKARVWLIEPSHPIAGGLPEYIELPQEETYGERFDIPAPEQLVAITWHSGGEVFRSGCCWTRGHGKIFYFQPGHETFPTYYNPLIGKLLSNAAKWAAPVNPTPSVTGWVPSMEG
jgi:trehalose utilization protein